jgi:hypothetical protein
MARDTKAETKPNIAAVIVTEADARAIALLERRSGGGRPGPIDHEMAHPAVASIARINV